MKGLFVILGSIVAAIVVNALLILGDPGYQHRHERIDILAPGPYLVQKWIDGRPVYLGWENKAPVVRTTPVVKLGWTADLRFAWRFITWDSAAEEVAKNGGLVVQLREVAG